MSTSRRIRLAALCTSLALLSAACAATRIQETWKDPSFDARSYKRVLVVGVGGAPHNQKLLELRLAANLTERGVEAITAHPMKTHSEAWTKEELRALVADQGADAVLIPRLQYIDNVEKDPAAAPVVVGYYGYYYSSYRIAYLPDSPESMDSKFAVLETKLYSIATGEVVWSMKTRTSLASRDILQLIDDFARLVAKTLYDG